MNNKLLKNVKLLNEQELKNITGGMAPLIDDEGIKFLRITGCVLLGGAFVAGATVATAVTWAVRRHREKKKLNKIINNSPSHK